MAVLGMTINGKGWCLLPVTPQSLGEALPVSPLLFLGTRKTNEVVVSNYSWEIAGINTEVSHVEI